MTGTHLELDALADLLAGEGGDDDVTHVGACAGCAGRLDELAEAEQTVVAALAALPAPVIPPGLADRLTAALAAEPSLTAPAPAGRSATAGDAVGRSGTVTPFPTAQPRRPVWLPAVAAGLVLLAGAGVGAAVLTGGVGSSEQNATAAGADESAAESLTAAGLPTSSTGADYGVQDGALAAALPALLTGDAPPLSGASSGEFSSRPDAASEPLPAPAPASPPSAAPDGSSTGESGTEESGTEDSTERFGSGGSGTEESGPQAPGADQLGPVEDSAGSTAEDPLAPLRAPDGLASCLAALLPPDDDTVRPLALDYAAYAGQPALVVVLPAGGAPDKLDLFVVGAGCSQDNDSTLFFTRLDRPG